MYSAGTFYPQLEPTIITGMDTAGTQLAPSSNYWDVLSWNPHNSSWIPHNTWDVPSCNPAGTSYFFLNEGYTLTIVLNPAGTLIFPAGTLLTVLTVHPA